MARAIAFKPRPPLSADHHEDFHLGRFLGAQQAIYPTALAELRAGSKQSHWMWFIFPQIAGLGHSPMAQRYAISGRAEARAYLADRILGARLAECTQAMLTHAGRLSAHAILGSPDDMKFRSSMTLFDAVGEPGAPFGKALDAFYQGQRDERTLQCLQAG